MRLVLKWNRFGDRLWSLGRDRMNLWLWGLLEQPLNSMNGRPMAFERKSSFALEVGVE